MKLYTGTAPNLVEVASAGPTGTTGSYSFAGLGNGSYTVCEFAPLESPSYLGWTQSTPGPGTICPSDAEPNGIDASVSSESTRLHR